MRIIIFFFNVLIISLLLYFLLKDKDLDPKTYILLVTFIITHSGAATEWLYKLIFMIKPKLYASADRNEGGNVLLKVEVKNPLDIPIVLEKISLKPNFEDLILEDKICKEKSWTFIKKTMKSTSENNRKTILLNITYRNFGENKKRTLKKKIGNPWV